MKVIKYFLTPFWKKQRLLIFTVISWKF